MHFCTRARSDPCDGAARRCPGTKMHHCLVLLFYKSGESGTHVLFCVTCACCITTTTRESRSGSLFGNSRVKRQERTCSASVRLLHHSKFLKGPILVHCIPYYWVFDCNFEFVYYFPFPCGSCSRRYPIGDYYIFVLWLNGIREGDGAILKEKKNIWQYELWRYVNVFVLCKENPKKICDMDEMTDEKTSFLLREWK